MSLAPAAKAWDERGRIENLIAWIEGLVVLHELARMPSGVQHHAALYLGAIRARDMRAAIPVLHLLHFGQLECNTYSDRSRSN